MSSIQHVKAVDTAKSIQDAHLGPKHRGSGIMKKRIIKYLINAIIAAVSSWIMARMNFYTIPEMHMMNILLFMLLLELERYNDER